MSVSTYPKIWISNSCGKLFFFKDVPKEDNGDINEWFNCNDIDEIVDNNFSSCDWGEYETTKKIKTPKRGWKVEEESDSEDDEEIDGEMPAWAVDVMKELPATMLEQLVSDFAAANGMSVEEFRKWKEEEDSDDEDSDDEESDDEESDDEESCGWLFCCKGCDKPIIRDTLKTNKVYCMDCPVPEDEEDDEMEECDECGTVALLESLAYGALDVNLCPPCHAKSWADHPENKSV